METLFDTLLKLFPLPDSLQILPASQLPGPRATIKILENDVVGTLLPLEPATKYYDATLMKNMRITSPGWYQDTRHLTFHFKEEIE